jgi:hypothetical protein
MKEQNETLPNILEQKKTRFLRSESLNNLKNIIGSYIGIQIAYNK